MFTLSYLVSASIFLVIGFQVGTYNLLGSSAEFYAVLVKLLSMLAIFAFHRLNFRKEAKAIVAMADEMTASQTTPLSSNPHGSHQQSWLEAAALVDCSPRAGRDDNELTGSGTQ